MGLRTVIFICWLMPLALLVPILYQEFRPLPQSAAETTTAMRIRTCREHIVAARADPEDHDTRTALDECVTAGYISADDIRSATD